MGFGDSFVSWVDMIYSNVRSFVNVYGYLSQPFSLSHGVRQVCPLSPLLYVLVSEVLSVNIPANPRICGLLVLVSKIHCYLFLNTQMTFLYYCHF